MITRHNGGGVDYSVTGEISMHGGGGGFIDPGEPSQSGGGGFISRAPPRRSLRRGGGGFVDAPRTRGRSTDMEQEEKEFGGGLSSNRQSQQQQVTEVLDIDEKTGFLDNDAGMGGFVGGIDLDEPLEFEDTATGRQDLEDTVVLHDTPERRPPDEPYEFSNEDVQLLRQNDPLESKRIEHSITNQGYSTQESVLDKVQYFRDMKLPRGHHDSVDLNLTMEDLGPGLHPDDMEITLFNQPGMMSLFDECKKLGDHRTELRKAGQIGCKFRTEDDAVRYIKLLEQRRHEATTALLKGMRKTYIASEDVATVLAAQDDRFNEMRTDVDVIHVKTYEAETNLEEIKTGMDKDKNACCCGIFNICPCLSLKSLNPLNRLKAPEIPDNLTGLIPMGKRDKSVVHGQWKDEEIRKLEEVTDRRVNFIPGLNPLNAVNAVGNFIPGLGNRSGDDETGDERSPEEKPDTDAGAEGPPREEWLVALENRPSTIPMATGQHADAQFHKDIEHITNAMSNFKNNAEKNGVVLQLHNLKAQELHSEVDNAADNLEKASDLAKMITGDAKS